MLPSPAMNTSDVYRPPESPPQSPPDGSHFTSPPPPSSPPPRVAYGDHRSNTASTVIAALSLGAIFLALAFLVGYGVYRFGTGFLLGKRVPRERGGVTGDKGGINARVKGGSARRGEGIGGGLDTVVEVPGEEEKEEKEEEEEEEERRRGDMRRDMRRSGPGGKFVDVESGRWW